MAILNFLPTWGIFIITAVITFLSFEGGFFLGRLRKKSAKNEPKAPVSSIIGATLGLLAFVLAFTFGLAASRFQERIMLVVNDANAIETAYERARFLPDPQKTEIRNLIYEYVRIREPNSQFEIFEQITEKSETLLNQLWDQTVIIGKNNPNSVISGLFITSINKMMDLHSKRIMIAAKIGIPLIIWTVLYLVTILSMTSVGYYSGLFNSQNRWINFTMIIAFSSIIFLIADLDNPYKGFIKVTQAPMKDLLKKLSVNSMEKF